MGGDGGVIASNRKFMRGAGTANKTGDLNRHAAQKFNAQEAMTTCALTKTPLYTTGGANNSAKIGAIAIVADPYGRLYHKEAAVQALLKRKQQQIGGDYDNDSSSTRTRTIGPQVRRLVDLYDVRFHREQDNSTTTIPTCPISGKALTGSIPAIVLVPGKDGMSNVVSESALSQLSPEELEVEYGQIIRRVRLAPDLVLLETIKEQVQQEHDKDDEERKAKKAAKKKSKRKRDGKDNKNESKNKNKRADENRSSSKKATNTTISSSSNGDTTDSMRRKIGTSTSSVGQQVQSRVDSAIQQNSVLSSLFINKDALSKVSEKDKKDNLFAR